MIKALHIYAMISLFLSPRIGAFSPIALRRRNNFLNDIARVQNTKRKHSSSENETVEDKIILYTLPSICMPPSEISSVIRSKILEPFYPKCFQDVFPRPKIVRDCLPSKNNSNNSKVILLDPDVVIASAVDEVSCDNEIIDNFPGISLDVATLLEKKHLASPGPLMKIEIEKKLLSLESLLTEVIPPEALPPPSGFEEIGHIIHVNLRKQHLPYKFDIGRIMLSKFGKKIRTVVNKVGEVGGPYRTYDFEIIASSSEEKDDYFVNVVEDGIKLGFDMRKVYWCSRLSGERKRMIKNDFEHGDIVADAFCGAGALVLNAAKNLNCKVIANDLNPDAVTYTRKNAEINQISAEMFDVECGDAKDFIRRLGTSGKILPNHLVMNFPLDSCSFLDQLRWWPSDRISSDHKTTVHLYTFARADNERTPVDVAIDMVADNLLPEGGYSEKTKMRRNHLDLLGCNVKAHEVRDVAPGKVVIYVSFSVTSPLIKNMQGEYLSSGLNYKMLNRKRARMKRV